MNCNEAAMFDSFRAYWYYSKLTSARGVSFERAAISLSTIKTEDSIRYLLDILVSRSDLSIEEKSHLARAFASIGRIASKYLLNQIYDDKGEIQYNVVSALGEIKETSAVPTFCFLFERTDNPIFARALADIGDTEALPLLRSKITGNSIARLESLEALFRIAPREEGLFLVSLLYSPHSIIRKHTVQMLSSLSYQFSNVNEENLYFALSSQWEKVTIAPGSLSLFCHFVNDDDAAFKRSIVLFLTKNDSDESRRVLYEFLSDTDSEFLAYLITHVKNAHLMRFEILDQLFSLLMHGSVIVRHLVEELILSFGASVLPDIIKELAEAKGRSLLFLTTLQTLCITIGHNALPYLYSALKEADQQTTPLILGIIGEIGSPVSSGFLVQFLSSSDVTLKKSAVRALGESGSAREIPLLTALLPDQSREVRMSLYDSLARIASRTGSAVHIEGLGIDAEEQAYVERLFGESR